EIQEALKKIDFPWLLEEAKEQNRARFTLWALAERGHPGLLRGLVDLANRDFEFARVYLRQIEMKWLMEEVLRGDVTVQADLIHFLNSGDLTLNEADQAAEGLLELAEKAFAVGNSHIADFALLKLYSLTLSPHRDAIFERIHPYEGTLFETLKELALNSSLG